MATVAWLTLATFAAAQPSAAPRDYVIGVQDVLSISLFDQPELGGKFTVELSGTFTFPLIGRIAAGGLTIAQFEHELHERLVAGNFFNDPQISVSVDQYRSQRVFVVGEVRIPGTYPLTRDTTLIELLSRAGSTTADAGDDVVVVPGQGPDAKGPTLPAPDASSGAVVRINLAALQSGTDARNIDLHNGDTVFVTR
ncbi:MAG TPA: polysaccharide biosynthesis/export family protein, partial [Vicinamibacterales bacterium]|nr:polysaccharide biosynthesis/export family protein [Vicinamibacterales bacterium]